MLHDAGRAHGLRFVVLRYFNVAGADPKLRTGQSTPAATHLIKVALRGRARQARRRWTSSAPTIRRRTAPASATTSMSAIWRARIRRRSRYLRSGGASATFNCGYGRGASVLEVIDAVKRVSGRDFPGRDRRAAAPAIRRRSSPTSTRIRATLDWRPQFEDLDTIVSHALAWERSCWPSARLPRLNAQRNRR